MFPLRGTPSERNLLRLKRFLNKNRNVGLCYVTGRDMKLTLEAIREHSLPLPDYIITDVGTNIYLKKKGSFSLYMPWKRRLKAKWKRGDAKRILDACLSVRGVTAQPKSRQSEFKVSFYLKPRKPGAILRQIRKQLVDIGIKTTIVPSKGRQRSILLDILPEFVSKKEAIATLAKRIGIGYSNVVFAGESGNDYHVLVSDFKAIVVSNADEELKMRIARKMHARNNSSTIYFASGKFDCDDGSDISGVLEGALHYGMFSWKKGMRIQMHSIHGLVDRNYTDLGRDDDTGGQIVYVVELAKSLSMLPGVEAVDLFTRRIVDKKYPSYAKSIEYITRNARIVRIDCGPKKYLKKTKLWPHIREYVKNVLAFNDEDGINPDILHANYADAGLACANLSNNYGVPMVFTAHSLGWPKMDKLGITKKNMDKFEQKFHFSVRLRAEQTAIARADAIVVSTSQEILEQYSKYAIDMSKVHVIPPGTDPAVFYPYLNDESGTGEMLKLVTKELSKPNKPMILAVSRLDRRKNLLGLVNAFCKSKKLPRMANLIILTGLKKGSDQEQKNIYHELQDIVASTGNGHNVSLVKFIDSTKGVGKLYRLAASTGGTLVNPALIEPFGLTIIEASACGLPVISTRNGGPRDIIHDGYDGLLVDPLNKSQIELTIIRLFKDKKLWKSISKNAIANASQYSWNSVAKEEKELFTKLLKEKESGEVNTALLHLFS